MDKLNYPLKFDCPDHPLRKLEGINPGTSTGKQTYCVICIIQSKDSNQLYNYLQTLPAFSKVLSDKAEAFNRMTIHINEQKRKIEDSIEKIKNSFAKMLDEKKTEFFAKLDEEFSKFTAEYDLFEPEIRVNFPLQEYVDKLFPTKGELENRFDKVQNAAECENFIRGVKIELEEKKNKMTRGLLKENEKRVYIDPLKQRLENIENRKPVSEIDVKVMEEQLRKILDENKTYYTFKSPILSHQSLRITGEDLLVVKAWLPEKFKANFTPKLIYKGIRDGMSGQVFHSQCDGKGPTITFIKCQFKESSEMTVIGGFLDKDWSQNGNWITSDNSFLFSLASRIKCPINNKQYGARGISNYGPIFGDDLHINQNLEESYVKPGIYENTGTIVKSSSYGGYSKIYFMPYDIEVYTIKF